MGLPTATAQSKLKTFRGLPHRIEWVASVGGRSFFNDSKSTNPDATEKAVSSFEENQVHVIICGVDKGLDLVGLVDYLNDRVVSVTVFGDIAGRFMTTVKSQNVSVPVTEVLHLRDALKAAYSASSTGDVILFSPACSSFDQFANFESRGDQFRAVVRDLESSEVSV